MKVNERKIENGITVVVHCVTAKTVYFARFRGAVWDGKSSPLRQMPRAEFAEHWSAAQRQEDARA